MFFAKALPVRFPPEDPIPLHSIKEQPQRKVNQYTETDDTKKGQHHLKYAAKQKNRTVKLFKADTGHKQNGKYQRENTRTHIKSFVPLGHGPKHHHHCRQSQQIRKIRRVENYNHLVQSVQQLGFLKGSSEYIKFALNGKYYYTGQKNKD